MDQADDSHGGVELYSAQVVGILFTTFVVMAAFAVLNHVLSGQASGQFWFTDLEWQFIFAMTCLIDLLVAQPLACFIVARMSFWRMWEWWLWLPGLVVFWLLLRFVPQTFGVWFELIIALAAKM